MKKKIVSCILSIITVFTLCAGTIGASASAAPAPYTVTVSGKTVKFEKNAGSYIKNSRLMVPAREMAAALGCTLKWDAKNKCAVISTKDCSMSLYIGTDSYMSTSNNAIGATAPQSYGAAPEIKNGRSFMPVCSLELLYYTISVSGKTVEIKTDDSGSQLPSPMVSYATVAQAAAAVSFKVKTPSTLKDIEAVNVIDGELVQVNYKGGICYRVSGAALRTELGGNISGDYNVYSNTSSIAAGGWTVTLMGNGNGVSLAVWGDGDNSYSIAFDTPVSSSDVSAIVASVA